MGKVTETVRLTSLFDKTKSRVVTAVVDTGANNAQGLPETDFEDDPRIALGPTGSFVDMAAYEYRSWDFKVTEVGKSGGKTQLTWTSRWGDTYAVRWCGDIVTGPWVIEPAVFSQGQSTT
jgi:hypothetical protein